MMKHSLTRIRLCRWLWLLLLATGPYMQLLAQSGAVTGTVRDEKGQPLPGVTIQVKGTQQGAQTDAKGAFSIPVSSGVTLVFSMMGYAQQEAAGAPGATLRITLQETSKDLGEVVVVGYGTQKKVNLTGALSVVKGEDMVKRSVASTSLALQGAAPGVTVTQQSGVPGGDQGEIRIRGISSMIAGGNPLVLVDNVEMSLDAVDANNIESITVLKDAAAASIYGSRAANGVILITTKRGGKQALSVEYNGYATWQQATNLPKKVSALEHMEMYDIAQQNVGQQPGFTQAIADYKQYGPDNFSRFNTDWKKLVLTNNGLMHSHNISLRAGTDRIRMFGSGSLLNQNGLTANTDFQRKDLRFNTDLSVTNNLTASLDLVMNTQDRTWPGLSSPNFIIMSMIAMPSYVPGKYNTGEWGEGWNNRNPAAIAEATGYNRSITRTQILTGTLTYKPVKGLELLATYSANNWQAHQKNMQKEYQVYRADVTNNTLVPLASYPGTNLLGERRIEYRQSIFRAQATYTHDWRKHSFKVLGGFSAEEYKADSLYASRTGFLNDDKDYLDMADAATMSNSGALGEWAMVSFYSRLNYSYNDKYLLELNGRWDASSRFRKQNRWSFFPSVSAGWRMSQEPFWKGISSVVSDAKLRASYGTLGNQGLNLQYPTYAIMDPANYYIGNKVNTGFAVNAASNPNLRWEVTRQVDVGLDLAFINNRLTLTADYFKRDISDMLQFFPIPYLTGYGAPAALNAGSMQNTGWELALGWQDKRGDFRYGAQAVLSDVKNKITDLNGEEYISGLSINRAGYAINSYYGYVAEGLFQSAEEIAAAPFHFSNTKPGDIRYKDISGPDGKPDGKIDNFDRTILGNSIPRYEYSLNLNAGYKGFDLTAFFQGVGKRDNYLSGNGAWAFYSSQFQGTAYEWQKDYWRPDNPGASYPRLTVNNDYNQKNSSYWMRSGAYLRLKNVVLGYTLPASLLRRMKISSWRFYISGQNLFTWDKFYPGFDPEIKNSDGEFYPIMKTYTIGTNIKF